MHFPGSAFRATMRSMRAALATVLTGTPFTDGAASQNFKFFKRLASRQIKYFIIIAFNDF
jgi:hypothetical protein